MARQPFLTFAELKRLTGETNPKAQVAVLHQHGLRPFINQATGQAIIYREVVMQSMGRIESSLEESTYINWDVLDERNKQNSTKVQTATVL